MIELHFARIKRLMVNRNSDKLAVTIWDRNYSSMLLRSRDIPKPTLYPLRSLRVTI